MARPRFSLRFLLAATALVAADIAAGIRLMPEADRQNLQVVWVGPVVLALAVLCGVLVCVAAVRCCIVVYESLQHGLRLCGMFEHRARMEKGTRS